MDYLMPEIDSTDYSTTTAEDTLTNSGGYGGGPLSFPKTLSTEWKHIIHFQRYEYSRADAKTPPTTERKGRQISLPVPLDLKSAYRADWQNESLGLVGNFLVGEVGNVVQKMKNNGGFNINSFKESVSQYAGENLGAKTKNLATAFGIDMVKDNLLGRAVSRATGMAVNPFKAVLYNAPDMRAFNFQYKLIPSNLDEANTIKDIIREFKLGMHPTIDTAFEDNIFKYPDIWFINIPNDEYLFKMISCVLMDASFDYHGEGTKTYFNHEKNIPFSVNMSLSFQETSILTREDIENGY